jgi:DtxR family manganese transport transcriptional regulator
VTVNRAVARLKRDGYVNTQPYRAIILTNRGRQLAAACRNRHDTVVAFLCSLGIPPAVAERDAEGIEHHVSPETLAMFQAALKKTAKMIPGRPE